MEASLRDAVRSGRLAAGTPLPSSRTLAVELGLARNTVAEAYGQLDEDLKPLKHYYLGDPAEVEAAMQAVANQGRAT